MARKRKPTSPETNIPESNIPATHTLGQEEIPRPTEPDEPTKETPQAPESPKRKLRVPKGCGAIGINGRQYRPDENGIVEVSPDDATILVVRNGFELVRE